MLAWPSARLHITPKDFADALAHQAPPNCGDEFRWRLLASQNGRGWHLFVPGKLLLCQAWASMRPRAESRAVAVEAGDG
jgi:hypothetical protein